MPGLYLQNMGQVAATMSFLEVPLSYRHVLTQGLPGISRYSKMWLAVILGFIVLLLVYGIGSKILEPIDLRLKMRWQDYPWASGDVLLFSGEGLMGRVGSATLKLMGGSPYTHVGLIYIDQRTGDVYVWEMVNADTGTRLTPVEKVLTRYKGLIAVRPIHGPTGRGVDNAAMKTFLQNHYGTKDYAYDFVIFTYNRLFPGLPLPEWTSEKDRPTRFCSELISETLQAVGALDYHDTAAVHCSIPRDFAQATQQLPLLPGWQLGEEVLLLNDSQ